MALFVLSAAAAALVLRLAWEEPLAGVGALAIIAAVVAMAQRLQLTVTAEGVETPEQLEFLRTEGCDLLQGFLTGRPVEADALEALLRKATTH